MPGTIQPPAWPSVANGAITIDLWLKQPRRVERVLTEMSRERFIADQIFTADTAEGGAVVYDRVSEQDLYLDDVPEAIAPSGEFPILGASEAEPKVATVTKYGGIVPLSYEAIRRNNRGVLQRQLRRLSNSLVKRHNEIAVTTLLADPDIQTHAALNEWNASSGTIDIFGDLLNAKMAVEQLDLGYIVDMAILNPVDYQSLVSNSAVRSQLPRENTQVNPLLTGELRGLAGIPKWLVTNRMPVGKCAVLNSKIVGGIHDEIPMYSRVIDEPKNETQWIQGARVSTPAITDPKAVFVITGVHE